MANTYRTSVTISSAGTANLAADTHTKTGTLAGDSDVISDTQDIGTSSEAITLGEITAGNAEFVELTNLDGSNFVSVSFENPAVAGTKAIKIKAGQTALLPTPSGALYAIADTATVKILKRAVES